jgi:sterol desaturase/sphingolipid hydroxylase (fatty acid hydroxylase superfamily)
MLELFDLRGFLILFLVFVPVEQLLPLRAGQKLFRRGWLADLLHFFFTGLMIRLGLLLVVLGAMAAGAGLPLPWRQAVAAQPLWLQAILVLLIADLGFYLAHRLFHSVPSLWHFHAVHHSIEEMDWLAAHRVHPIDHIVTKSASLVPIFVIGFSEAAIAIFAATYLWQSHLIHSNVRIRFGPLRWLIASPEFHHWHHANQREAYDKNFAGQLPLWDVLFGTLHMPQGRMPAQYGVDDPVPRTYPMQLAYPFIRLRRAGIRRAAGRPKAGQDQVSDAAEAAPAQGDLA